MILIETDAICWSYVGEGNQNLIIRYHGDNSSFKGKVLRVHKSRDAEIKGPDEDAVRFKQQFIDIVMQPLLGREYITAMVPVKTTPTFLEQIARRVEPYRPAERLNTRIVVNTPYSLLLDDLTASDTATVVFELKPKWGFKPTFGHSKKRAYCRYCMHSHLRQQMTNGYCPLDLYSDDPIRIERALKILFDTPIKKTLKATVQDRVISLSAEQVRLRSLLTAVLVQDPILSRLKQLQSQLDSLDVEGIWPLFERYQPRGSNDIDLWKQVIDRFLNQLPCPSEREKAIQRIYEYVLSMTFKDCSLMIEVGPAIEDKKRTKSIEMNGQTFSYRITVIDIDLKDISKIPYWYQLDQTIVRHAVETDYQKPTACQE